MLQFLGTILNALIVLFFFSFTIFVHELGHFLVARRLGFKILEFSIGFGPAIWKRTINGIVYKIASIPLGGYVKLPQMDPTGVSNPLSQDGNKLPNVEPWKRIAVGVAGVTCNLILAVILATVISFTGRPAAERDFGTTIDFIDTNSVLYAAGLRPGDHIESINGRSVHNWDHVITEGALNPEAIIQASRNGKLIQARFATNSAEAAANVFAFEMEPVSPAVIGLMFTNWPAYQSGLRTGDRIVAIDGTPVIGRGHMISLVTKSGGRTLQVEYERKGLHNTIAITPRYDEKLQRHRIGNSFQPQIIHPRPLDEVRYAGGAVFRLLDHLTTRQSAGRAFDAIGGVPEIFFAFWQMTKAGLITAISFAVTINVNLAILNLLPFMVLDGGHICLALWEWITRRQASPRLVSALWQAGAVCLISLMLFLTLRGIYRVNKWNTRINEITAAAVSNRADAASSLLNQEPVNAPP